MILTCASCETRYYADDGLIGPNGRSVRCAACGHTWFAESQLVLESGDQNGPAKSPGLTRDQVERMRRQQSAANGPAPSAAARFRQQQAERMRKERFRASLMAWGATGAAMAATATGAVILRQDVAELWPNSAGAFTALGLDVNVYGLEIMDLQVSREFDGATPVVVVSGEVRNIGRDDKTAPPLRLTLRDEHSNPVFEIVQAMTYSQVAAGTAIPFSIRLENPPTNAVDLEASFAAPGEGGVAAPAGPDGAPAAADPTLELSEEHLAPEISEELEPHAMAPSGFGDGLMPYSEPSDQLG